MSSKKNTNNNNINTGVATPWGNSITLPTVTTTTNPYTTNINPYTATTTNPYTTNINPYTANNITFTGVFIPQKHLIHTGIEYQLVDNGEVYLVSTFGIFKRSTDIEVYEHEKSRLTDTARVELISALEFLDKLISRRMV